MTLPKVMKACGSDLLDHAEQDAGLVFPADDHDYLRRRFRVPALAVEQRDAAVHLAEDAFGDLIVLRRDDQYLRRLPVAGHHRVDRVAEHGDHYVAVDNRGNILENEQRAADDNQVAQHQYLAVAYSLVLVDDQRDDVGSAGAAALSEADADAGSRQRAAQNGRQQLVVGQSEHVAGNGLLHDGHRDGDGSRSRRSSWLRTSG